MLFNIPSDTNPQVYILWLLRERRAHDWKSLSREFGLDPEFPGTASGIFLNYLYSLRDAGLIVMADQADSRSYEIPSGPIKLSENWIKIQTALGLSLTELTKLGDSAIIVTSYFGKPKGLPKATDLFVLMPFDPQLRPVYEDHITQCAHELNLSIARGDDLFTAHSVTQDIWNAISGARAVIADCTGRNPNVFYEIGLAHAIGKPVILITQKTDDVPFDIRHLRYIQYDYTPRGMRIFEKVLTDTLRAELSLEQDKDAVRMPVLFIAGDESDDSRMQLNQEFAAIETALGAEKMNSEFSWTQWYRPDLAAATSDDDFKARIVHVVGHPGGPDAIMASGETGSHRYEPAALATVLHRVRGVTRCVILSACFSAEQAAAIASEIPYVIGIHSDIGYATTSFAVDFYRSLSAGRSIAEAHEIASNRLRLEGVPEVRLPALLEKKLAVFLWYCVGLRVAITDQPATSGLSG